MKHAVAALLLAFCSLRAQSPPHSVLLVLNKSDDMLAVVDPESLQVLRRIPTGRQPHEVTASADGRFAYVSNYGTGPAPGKTISVIDLKAATGKEVPLGALLRPHGILEAQDRVYFTAEGSRVVARFDPASQSVDWLMGTGQAGTHMLVVAARANKLYTANIGSDTVTSIALSAPATVKQIAVGKGPEGMDLSPDGGELWVGTRGDGGLSIIDAAGENVKETLHLGRVPIRVKFTPDGARVLVSDTAAGELIVLDAASRKELKRLPIAGEPVGVLVTPDGKRAFVASTHGNKIFEIDLQKLAVSRSFETGREPDGMAWAGRN